MVTGKRLIWAALAAVLLTPALASAQTSPTQHGPFDTNQPQTAPQGTPGSPYYEICVSGCGGGGGAVYGQNGTSAMSAANPFADNIAQFGGVTVSLGLAAASASMPTVDANIGLSYAASSGVSPTGGIVSLGEYNATLPTVTTGHAIPNQTDVNGQQFVRDTITEAPISSLGAGPTTGKAVVIGDEYIASVPTLTTNTIDQFLSDVNGNLKVTERPGSAVPTAIAASLPALGATPTAIAAAGAITQGFTIQNNSTAPAFWSVTAASGTTLTYLNAEVLAVGASFTSTDTMPMGGALQVQSSTATACTVSATTGCIEGHYK